MTKWHENEDGKIEVIKEDKVKKNKIKSYNPTTLKDSCQSVDETNA